MSFGEDESCVDPRPPSAYHDRLRGGDAEEHHPVCVVRRPRCRICRRCDGNSWSKAASLPANDPLVTAWVAPSLHAAGLSRLARMLRLPVALLLLKSDARHIPGRDRLERRASLRRLPGPVRCDRGDWRRIQRSVRSAAVPKVRTGAQCGWRRGVPDVAYNAAILHGVLIRFS